MPNERQEYIFREGHFSLYGHPPHDSYSRNILQQALLDAALLKKTAIKNAQKALKDAKLLK